MSQNEILDSFKSVLREEFQNELRPLSTRVEQMRADLTGAFDRIHALERCFAASSVASPRSALRSNSSEPPRKSPRASISFSRGNSVESASDVSSDTLVFNGFPEHVSRKVIQH